jgi:hypothetical protein
MGDPAMLLRSLTTLLAIDGYDTLQAEARATAQSILVALPNAEMQARFRSAQTVQQLALTFPQNPDPGLSSSSTLAQT